MKRKILLVLLISMGISGYTLPAQSADKPTVPVPNWDNAPPTQSYNPQQLSSKPPTAPPASIAPTESLNGLPVRSAPAGAQTATGTQPIKQLQIKPKQMHIKSEAKALDSKKVNQSAEAQHQTTPVHKMAPLPPTRKKVKNPATPEQK